MDRVMHDPHDEIRRLRQVNAALNVRLKRAEDHNLDLRERLAEYQAKYGYVIDTRLGPAEAEGEPGETAQ